MNHKKKIDNTNVTYGYKTLIACLIKHIKTEHVNGQSQNWNHFSFLYIRLLNPLCICTQFIHGNPQYKVLSKYLKKMKKIMMTGKLKPSFVLSLSRKHYFTHGLDFILTPIAFVSTKWINLKWNHFVLPTHIRCLTRFSSLLSLFMHTLNM